MADVAHELRTPLTVLQGRLEGLLDGVYPRDDAQLGDLLEETHVLSRLIEDLRTLALSEAGALQLEREPTDIAALARDVAAAFAGEAAARQVTIQVRSDGLASIAIDPVRIREVLTNLVLERASAQRRLAARARLPSPFDRLSTTGRQSCARVAVSVADTGAGMTPEEAQRVFARFYKGPGSGGSGLGLAIARGLSWPTAEASTVASEPGLRHHDHVHVPANGQLICRNANRGDAPCMARRRLDAHVPSCTMGHTFAYRRIGMMVNVHVCCCSNTSADRCAARCSDRRDDAMSMSAAADGDVDPAGDE